MVKGVLLMGVLLAGRFVPGRSLLLAFLFLDVLFLGPRSWMLCWRGVLFLGVTLIGSVKSALQIADIGSPGSPRQSRQSAATRPPTASPCSRVVAGCFKGVSWEGLNGRLRIYF